MLFPFLALLSSMLLTTIALPSGAFSPNLSTLDIRSLTPRDISTLTPLSLRSLAHLSPRSPDILHLATQIRLTARALHHKRNPFALPKGGGGGKPGKPGKPGSKAPPGQKSPGGSGQGVSQPPPPGMSADGVKAWEQCRQGANNAGDCSAMKGAFAEMGCSLGSIHLMAPCENKEVQAALNKQRCAKEPGARFC